MSCFGVKLHDVKHCNETTAYASIARSAHTDAHHDTRHDIDAHDISLLTITLRMR